MGLIRTTITLDEAVAVKVRQMFEGNLSRGINALLTDHLFKERKESCFGLLKGKNLILELERLKKEEGEAYANLYRGY